MDKKKFVIIMFFSIIVTVTIIVTGVILLIKPPILDDLSKEKTETTENAAISAEQIGTSTESSKNNEDEDVILEAIPETQAPNVSDVSPLTYVGEDASLYANRTMGEEEDIANAKSDGINIKNKNELESTVLPYDGARIIEGYLKMYMQVRTGDNFWNVYIDVNSMESNANYVRFNAYVETYPDAVINCEYDILNNMYDFTSSYFD